MICIVYSPLKNHICLLLMKSCPIYKFESWGSNNLRIRYWILKAFGHIYILIKKFIYTFLVMNRNDRVYLQDSTVSMQLCWFQDKLFRWDMLFYFIREIYSSVPAISSILRKSITALVLHTVFLDEKPSR